MNPKVTAFWAALVFFSGLLMFDDHSYEINDRIGQVIMVSVAGTILAVSLRQIFFNKDNKPQS